MNTILLCIHVLWFLASGKLQAELCNLYTRTSSSRSVWHSDRVGEGLVCFVSSEIKRSELERYGARTLSYIVILKEKNLVLIFDVILCVHRR